MKTTVLVDKTPTIRSCRLLAPLCMVGMLLGATAPDIAEAAFYKCVNSEGAVTYSTSACPSDEQVAKVIQGGTTRAALDCRIARNFTRQVAPMVVNGESPDTAFNRYGGINALSPTTIGLINYLYSFKHTPDIRAARISSLAISRCENGSFGPTDCAQFPAGFIDDLGGCEGALVLGGIRPDATASRLERREAAYATTQASQAPAAARPLDPRLAQQRPVDRVEDCRARIKDKINSVNRQMRSVSSVSRQDTLRAERHDLGRKLSNCSK